MALSLIQNFHTSVLPDVECGVCCESLLKLTSTRSDVHHAQVGGGGGGGERGQTLFEECALQWLQSDVVSSKALERLLEAVQMFLLGVTER